MDRFTALLPLLGPTEAWIVGLIVVLAVLRPVGRQGWAVAAAVGVAALGIVATPIYGDSWSVLAALAWLVVAVLLVAAAALRPLRWEPRTGPSAAAALIVGAAVVHVAAALWSAHPPFPPIALATVADAWGEGRLVAADLGPATAGPLGWPLVWAFGVLPSVGQALGAALVGLGAAATTVLGAERLGRRWGHVGTARCTAAAVAWAPPLLLAHGAALATLVATAALVWSLWALLEIWGGRHRSGRLALLCGALLGVAGGAALWPLVVLPLWVRRLGGRAAAWFVVGLAAAAAATLLVLVPTDVAAADVWRVGVLDAVQESVRGWIAVPVALVIGVALATVVASQPLSPTRLVAAAAALLLAVVAWWPAAAGTVGPVAAVPFLLLAAVAPERPQERWPPDASVAPDLGARAGV